MKQRCKYHPGAEAKWYCPHDGIALCDECVGGDDPEGRVARCLVCNKSLQQVLPLLRQTPFWQVLPHFMRYPLNLSALLLMLAVALPLLLTGFTWLTAAVLLVAGMALGRYGEAALMAAMEGDLNRPALSVLADAEGWPNAVPRWLLFSLALVSTAAALHYLGMAVASLTVALWALLLPSLFIALTAFANPGKALARVHAAPLVLGRHYLQLVLAFLVAGLLALFAVLVLQDLLAGWLAAPLAMLLAGWLYLFICHLSGYLCCQYQDELQLPTQGRQRAARRRRNRRPEDERRLMVLLREGRYDKVRAMLEKQLLKTPQVLALNEQYMKLLQAMADDKAVLAAAENYLQALIKAEQRFRIPELVREFRRLDSGFRPAAPDICYRVAEALDEAGDAKLAVWMLQDLHQRAPDWHGVAEAYIFMARVLAEKLDAPAKGLQYLKFVEQRYRMPKVREQVRVCREAIEAL